MLMKPGREAAVKEGMKQLELVLGSSQTAETNRKQAEVFGAAAQDFWLVPGESQSLKVLISLKSSSETVFLAKLQL